MRGRIIYANPAFVEVSGFSREELVGSAHNIVRHPDMPEEAFADLRRTIQRGDSWTGGQEPAQGRRLLLGAGQRHAHHGARRDHLLRLGARQAHARKQVEAAEAVYARLRSGARRSPERGQPSPPLRGLLARLMLWRLTGVRSRMLAWPAWPARCSWARPAWPSPRCMTE